MKTIAAFLIIGSLSAFAGDPSLKALPDPTGRTKYAERSRIIVDLDSDGMEDMLLSGSPDEFGTIGGPWAVHLNRDGDYKRIGEVWAHPLAIAVEPDQARIHTDPKVHRFARVWVYLKASGSAGSFGYFRVGKDSVDEIWLPSRFTPVMAERTPEGRSMKLHSRSPRFRSRSSGALPLKTEPSHGTNPSANKASLSKPAPPRVQICRDNSTSKPQSKPRPRAGVRGLRRSAQK